MFFDISFSDLGQRPIQTHFFSNFLFDCLGSFGKKPLREVQEDGLVQQTMLTTPNKGESLYPSL